MIKTLVILLSLYSEPCLSVKSYVKFNITKEDNIEKFPWLVTISGEDKTKIYAYGTLIHEKAVLTMARMDYDEPQDFKFKVFAKCYSNTEPTVNYHCSEVRDVIEYNILEDDQPDYDRNLAVLILSKPFTLSEAIKPISFANEGLNYHHDCAVISLRHQINSQNHTQNATLAFATQMEVYSENDDVYHHFYQPLQVNNEGLKLYDDRRAEEQFLFDDLLGETLDFTGGPLICKSMKKDQHWLLVAVADFKIKFYTYFSIAGRGYRVDHRNIQEVLDEIIKLSYFPSKEHHESQLNLG